MFNLIPVFFKIKYITAAVISFRSLYFVAIAFGDWLSHIFAIAEASILMV